jgi:hypothetical protein
MDRAKQHAKNIAKGYAHLSLFSNTGNGGAEKLTENAKVMDTKENIIH